MKVYVVMEQSSWQWSYADHGDDMSVRCICLTKEKAEDKIRKLVSESKYSDKFVLERDDEGALYAFHEEDHEDFNFWYDEMEVEE